MVAPRKGEPGTAAEVSRHLGLGLTWAASTGLFLYLGSLADRWLDSAPWLTLIGAFTGAVAGFWYMYHHLVIAPARRKRDGEGEAER